ncbi:hypothetical protein GJ496_005241 [Pomphorhynchus laevis]|nr:hypothetical protein GJ496_005241 [Pomphorhynchus laevis]
MKSWYISAKPVKVIIDQRLHIDNTNIPAHHHQVDNYQPQSAFCFQISEVKVILTSPLTSSLSIWVSVNDQRPTLCKRIRPICIKSTVFPLNIKCTVFHHSHPNDTKVSIILYYDKDLLGLANLNYHNVQRQQHKSEEHHITVDIVNELGFVVGKLKHRPFKNLSLWRDSKQFPLHSISLTSSSSTSTTAASICSAQDKHCLTIAKADMFRRRLQDLINRIQIDIRKKDAPLSRNVFPYVHQSAQKIPQQQTKTSLSSSSTLSICNNNTSPSQYQEISWQVIREQCPPSACALIEASFAAHCHHNSNTSSAASKCWQSLAKSVFVIDPYCFPSDLILPVDGMITIIGTDVLVNACIRALLVQMSFKSTSATNLRILYAPVYDSSDHSLLTKLLSHFFGKQFDISFIDGDWPEYCKHGDTTRICNYLLNLGDMQRQTTTSLNDDLVKEQLTINSIDLHLSQVVLSRGIESKLIPFIVEVSISTEGKTTLRLDYWQTIRQKNNNGDKELRRRIRIPSITCRLYDDGSGNSQYDGLLNVVYERKNKVHYLRHVNKLVCSSVKHKRLDVSVDSVLSNGVKFVQISPNWHTHVDRLRFCCY